jgi:hypothetical protein
LHVFSRDARFSDSFIGCQRKQLTKIVLRMTPKLGLTGSNDANVDQAQHPSVSEAQLNQVPANRR